MRRWMLLAGAIITEVIGTLSLRATVDHPAWIGLVAAAYLTAFVLLGLTLRTGMAIGVAYGIWGACGVALVALLGAVLFGESLSIPAIAGIAVITRAAWKDPLTKRMVLGIALIVVGVVLVEIA